ncbi:MAG: hypothetical protein ACE5FQ_04995 [Thiogranum sp.]
MKGFLISLLVPLLLLTGCSEESVSTPVELNAFIDELKAEGVDGSVLIRPPFNEDMEYVMEYAIAKYASTRIISLFRFKDAEKAEENLQAALRNDKLSGQARNGKFVMAATFFPADEAAVEKIKALFLAQKFD